MKKLLFLATLLLTFGVSKAQISDVQQKGSYLYVYGENNKQLSSLYIKSTDEYLGMGASFFIIKKESYIYVYDYNSRQISSKYITSSDKFKNVAGSSFNIQNGSYIYTYDKQCKQISSRYNSK